ncbi:MAG: MmgE/PrpD family protein [Chloroflexota bacterium]
MARVVERADVAELLAKSVVEVTYDDLSDDTVEVTKRSILDTMGVATAASGLAPELIGVVDLVKEAGGKEESTIWGFGGKVPAWMAAFANGAMAHALDYDDVFDEFAVHPSATTVPAAFATAERIGGVSGKEFITAVALGNDIIGRMAKAVVWKRDWFLTPLFGVFAATATAGKLLRLDADGLTSAFGIALCQAAGTMEIVYGVGANIRGMYDSFVGKAGVLAALLAQRGVEGVRTSLEGKAGLFNVYFRGEYDRQALMTGLGKDFEGARVSFKPWPCCRFSHPYVTALLALVRQHHVLPGEIESITVETSSASEQLCVPHEARRRPATSLDAKFSIPYIVALAALKGDIVLEDFSPVAIRDAESLAFAQKVKSRLNTELDAHSGRPQGKVELKMKDGRVYSHTEEFAYGHPRNPISKDDISRKFADCASHSAQAVTKDNVEGIIQMAGRLETVSDVRQITRLLP